MINIVPVYFLCFLFHFEQIHGSNSGSNSSDKLDHQNPIQSQLISLLNEVHPSSEALSKDGQIFLPSPKNLPDPDPINLGYPFAFDAAASHAGPALPSSAAADTSHAAASDPSHPSPDSGHGGSGEHDSGHAIHAPEILYIFLTLIIGAIARYGLKLVRHRFVMPYTVFVLLLGCIYGLLEYAFNWKGNMKTYVQIATADPMLILLIFLPGLIYEAAFSMQTHLFKKLFLHMLIIGTAGLAFNVVLIGYISQEMFQSSDANNTSWNIEISMLFSAIVSATDPIAAVALLKEAGSAKTLITVLEGTSLLSDTSAVVLFKLLIQVADPRPGKGTTPGEEVTSFVQNVLGGPAWGFFVGFLLTSLLSRMSSVWKAELILILTMPYLVFWTSDAAFDISGALATMVLGLWMSSHRTSISPDVEELVNRIWELVSLISNTLIFSLVGVIIVQTTLQVGDHMEPLKPSDWFDLIMINIFLILVRAIGFILLKPILNHFGIGAKVFTWPHIFVLSWGGFKGAVTLALGIMAAKQEFITNKEVRTKLLFHSAGVVAFTLLFNASTMRFLLKRLGILDMPLSEMITMHMAMKQILMVRNQKLDALKTDRYLADADWQRVDHLTKIDCSRYGIEEEGETSLWTIHYVTREVSCPSCDAEVQLEPLQTELAEMEGIARLRLVNAKKTSYWRQYEEGTLSQNGIKHLDDLSDTVLSSDQGVIDAEDIKHCLHDELWTKFKQKLGLFQYWIDNRKSTIWCPPERQWQRCFFSIVTSSMFKYSLYVVILANIAETITDWIIDPPNQTSVADSTGTSTPDPTSTSTSDDDTTRIRTIFLYFNLFFTIAYSLEAFLKIVGLGWNAYWGKGWMSFKSWLSWNRFDFFLLILTYVDLVMDFVMVYDDNLKIKGMGIITLFRLFKFLRFGRTIRFLKPLMPKILHLLDERINAHLFVAYDIAKAFMVAQEECSMMVPTVIGYKPLATKFKTQADVDCRTVLKEIGLLNEKRPDVAAAVKTRQAIRSILNHLHKSVEHMRSQGILDAYEVDHLQATIEARLKKLQHFPHSIAIVHSLDRLWNVPWINGSQEVFDIMKMLFEERHHEIATQFLSVDNEADGIYVLISGVVSITYQRAYLDNPELGEIYNSDNLRAVINDVSSDGTAITAEDGPRLDYILAGGLMNEQSLALGFPRRSQAVSDTVVSLLYLDGESFFRTMAILPALEARFWRRLASSVALNILIQLGSLTDSTFEMDKLRLARAAVRLVRPGVRIIGLDEFEDVFLIIGTLTDMTTTEHDAIIGPRKVPATYREVEVRQGRPAVTKKTGQIIYPEYAILFLIPPGNRDLSMVNVHDSQANIVERPLPDPSVLRDLVKTSMMEKTGHMPTDAELPDFLHGSPQHPPESHHGETPGFRERRGSNVGAMISYGKSKHKDSTQTMFNVLAYHRESLAHSENPDHLTSSAPHI